jgi:elongation factor G
MKERNHSTRPVLSVTIRPAIDCDHEKLERVRSGLVEKFAWMDIKLEIVDGQILLGVMSERELDIVCAVARYDLKVPLEVSGIQVHYLETIEKQAEMEGKYIRQNGGVGNYGHCKIRLTPAEPGTEFRFINEIKNGAIPQRFLASIEEGVREALASGVVSGYPAVDVTATLFDGSFHEQDSNETAYKIAASNATKEALRKASPLILEPVMLVEIVAPESCTGIILSSISDRRGRIDHIERHAFSQVIQAFIPLAETLGYAKELSSLTKREAFTTEEFAFYQPAPRNPGPSSDHGGVTANKPSGPRPKHGQACAQPEADFEY